MSGTLEDVLALVRQMDPSALRRAQSEAIRSVERIHSSKWVPFPGTQHAGLRSEADILLFGGEAAGGKTDLGIGAALTQHQNSLVLRRQYTDLSSITRRAIHLNGTRDGFNGSPPPKLLTTDGRLIEFSGCARPDDWETWQGQPHDLIFFDEVVHFLESQVRNLMGWNRPVNPNPAKPQRCRVIMASNPPLGPEGAWIVDMFAPWLDDTYPNPARQGDLRWCVTVKKGDKSEDLWVDGPEQITIDGEVLTPLSRTFIRSRIDDNPYLRDDKRYRAMLDALEEPMRSAVRDGNFMMARRDSAFQVCPTSWVRAAQQRWKPEPPAGIPQCAIGVDVAQGGRAHTTLAPRYDGWFAPIIELPGKSTPDGATIAGQVVAARRDNSVVMVDMGGGYGGAAYEWLRVNIDPDKVKGYKGAEGTTKRSKSGNYKFVNVRSAAMWTFREALDPGQPHGSPIALPADPKLVADLTAATFEVTPHGIKVEPKEDVEARLGRSLDHGDAVIMSWWEGARAFTHAIQWQLGAEDGGERFNKARVDVDYGPLVRARGGLR